ncbi:MAG: DUF4190 domain-containing protein [Propionicimonas sp.]
MTNPFARPDQPDSDETIPLVPDAGYPDQSAPWSSGYESTTVDPLNQTRPVSDGYTNPVVPGPYGAPAAPSSGPLPPAAAPAPYPAAPAPHPATPSPYPPTAPAPTYEQPPLGYGSGPYEPSRESAPLVPAPTYSYVYSPQVDHPNSVPALVLGLLGFVFGITFPIAWYLGAKGNADIKREPQRYRSNGMLTAGMALGIFGTIMIGIGVLGMILFVVMVVSLGI